MLCVSWRIRDSDVVFLKTHILGRDVVRTISDATYTDTANMTDENCISYCSSKGLQYAGTEYAQECCMHFPEPSSPIIRVYSLTITRVRKSACSGCN